jgi:hypothetical protein
MSLVTTHANRGARRAVITVEARSAVPLVNALVSNVSQPLSLQTGRVQPFTS